MASDGEPGSSEGQGAGLVLASASRYRRDLLGRFGLTFTVDAAEIDETPLDGESPRTLVQRLSIAKARAVAKRWPNAVVVGSDQVATFDGRIVGKPGSAEAAVGQLLTFGGRRVDFLTGLAVLNAAVDRLSTHVDVTTTRFRNTTEEDIRRYVDLDQPLDCAGGIRLEGRGPCLLEGVDTEDPTAAIGLPLIKLAALLRAEGINPLRPT
ncbi:MAG: septum formation protein Maf [Pseudomonadales bacterium]|nr:septum formation protein Maf [Pseudomonadales bacterium]